MSKQGFTLIEVLLVLLLVPLILSLSLGILRLFIYDSNPEDKQFEVFKLQYRYLKQTVGQFSVSDDRIHYMFDGQAYSLQFDAGRLVKKPGYEILLFDVEALEEHQGCLSIYTLKQWYCLE